MRVTHAINNIYKYCGVNTAEQKKLYLYTGSSFPIRYINFKINFNFNSRPSSKHPRKFQVPVLIAWVVTTGIPWPIRVRVVTTRMVRRHGAPHSTVGCGH